MEQYLTTMENLTNELRDEKYQQSKNGIAKAIMETIEALRCELKNLNLLHVSDSGCSKRFKIGYTCPFDRMKCDIDCCMHNNH